MKVQSVKLVCFSPTGATKSIIRAIARGIDLGPAKLRDITKLRARQQLLQTSRDELLVIAVPVYIGRVPALLNDWLHGIKADKTPTVCVVVYGNRAYEDALLELKDIMKERGGIPIACAAFIGEHSFSSPDTPIAVSRPDATDIDYAEMIGRKINEILESIPSVDALQEISVPGKSPYRDAEPLLVDDFIDVSKKCLQCCVCAEACPVGAIDFDNCTLLDQEKCILCCACIKSCPENARTMKPSKVKEIAVRVSEMCKVRKEPESFF